MVTRDSVTVPTPIGENLDAENRNRRAVCQIYTFCANRKSNPR